jgi:hypothetical protein
VLVVAEQVLCEGFLSSVTTPNIANSPPPRLLLLLYHAVLRVPQSKGGGDGMSSSSSSNYARLYASVANCYL